MDSYKSSNEWFFELVCDNFVPVAVTRQNLRGKNDSVSDFILISQCKNICKELTSFIDTKSERKTEFKRLSDLLLELEIVPPLGNLLE